MNKQQRKIETLLTSLSEHREIEKVIFNLPRGYISIKKIAGHTYYYRQWREGPRVVSTYVPEGQLKIIEQKIKVRKENEELMKVINKSLKSAIKSVTRSGVINEAQLAELKVGVEYDDIELSDREAFIKSKFPEITDNIKLDVRRYIDGEGSYNNILISKWNIK